MNRLSLVLFAVCLASGSVAEAAGPSKTVDYAALRDERRIQAVRAAMPMTLDGALDEAAWRDATIAGGFLQSEPNEGEAASERTDVRVVYDDQYLYVGVDAHDSAPDDIIVSDLKKDFDPGASDA